MNNRFSIILEIAWVITGGLCILAGARTFVREGYSRIILIFGLMALISFLYAWFRHRKRKKS